MYVHSWCAHTPPLVAEVVIVTLLLLLALSLPTRPPVANQRATTQSQIKGNAHRSRRVARRSHVVGSLCYAFAGSLPRFFFQRYMFLLSLNANKNVRHIVAIAQKANHHTKTTINNNV